MADLSLLKPALYRVEGSVAQPDHPALLGGVCACGYVFFPLQHYGCERCGGLDLQPKVLSGAGELLASARVHLFPGKGREAPFTVGSIRLDDGPVVRTLLEVEKADLRTGTRMATCLVEVLDLEALPRLDLRFAPKH